VPIVLGASGVERIIEVKLTDQEKAALKTSSESVRGLVETMGRAAAQS
jgi:malate dehydrogenase